MPTVWTQAEIDQVKAAILNIVATGAAQTVSFADRSVTYYSLKDLLALLALMEGSLVTADGGTSTRFAATSKGLRRAGSRDFSDA
jgi:hypothetical protein